MTTLKTLADARSEILKAEIAALLHNLGKCSSAFIGQMTGTPSGYQDFSYQYIAGIVADWFAANQDRLSESDRQRVRVVVTKAALPLTYDFLNYEVNGQNVRAWFQVPQIQLPAPLNDRKYAFGEFIEFHKDWHRLGRGALPRITLVYGSEPRVTASLHAAHDAASGGEKEAGALSQQTHGLTQASAFGHEHEIGPKGLDRARIRLVKAVLQDQPDQQQILETSLQLALGDTRRPINDVSLWDLSASTSVLFKAALSGAILDDWKPWPKVRWRLLHVSFDGLAFWGQAHHVTDLLGRRQTLEEGLNAVRDILEVKYPLGNEVYRDEHGSVFVVPDADNLLELEDEDSKSLKKLLEQAFDGKGIRGELVPEIGVRPHDKGYEGNKIDLAGVLQACRRENAPQPDIAARWWAKDQRPENAEICTVCGWRPVGYVESVEQWVTSQKAKDRNVCGICLHRRGRRAHDWARNMKAEGEKLGPFERTIWTDEVADDNGRFALVVGRFVLEGWLDGKLIPTMLKSPSFARIRRCWDTTRQFWREVQNEVIPAKVGKRVRLGIRPTNVKHINDPDPDKGLGKWHTYEAEVSGRRLGLCWDPSNKDAGDRNLFWTTDNLDYLATTQLGITSEELEKRLENRTLPLYEPGGYLGQERPANADAERCQVAREEKFHPFIPLMIEPATFMALVPADRALAVVKAIKTKYDEEMARVRDRLPLHLGLIFAPRRTPVRAVLEAGQAMLEMPAKWEEWEVVSKEITEGTLDDGKQVPAEATLYLRSTNRGINPPAEKAKGAQAPSPPQLDGSSPGNGAARLTLRYPLLMGDGRTPDDWYPHLLLYEPNKRLEDKEQQGVVPQGEEPELKKQDDDFAFVSDLTGTVYIRPSRFDFEFLDTTARRFEIHYGNDGQRPRRTHPFLLDNLDRLEKLWAEMRNLEKSQCYQVISAIETTRDAWFRSDSDCKSWADTVFRQFVRDTLAGATWPKDHKWADIPKALREQLEDAGVSGELADLAELHMQILKE